MQCEVDWVANVRLDSERRQLSLNMPQCTLYGMQHINSYFIDVDSGDLTRYLEHKEG